MGYFSFILFYALLIETSVELMIKSMDMELLDWTEITPWKGIKLILMAGILIYQMFIRWTPFIAVAGFKKHEENIFVAPLQFKTFPWFFFSNIFHISLLLLFAFVIYKLNPNAWPLYLLTAIGATEITLYLGIGIWRKLFILIMGKNSIILSKGYLKILKLDDIKSVEKKYGDELYIQTKDGNVVTFNYTLLDKKSLSEFLIKLKNNCDERSIRFGNDVHT